MAASVSSSLSRWLLGFFAAALLALGLGWMYAAQRLGDYLHERAFAGAAFADFCTASDIGGFPFRLKLSCTGFSAPVRIGGQNLTLSADEAKGAASLWAPNHVVLTLSSPIALQGADGPFGKLRHDGLTLDFAWAATGLAEASARVQALDWRPETLLAGPALHAQALDFTARPQPRDGVPALHVEFSLDGLTAPALQNLLRDSGPNALQISADLTPPPPPRPDWREAMEVWRQAGGVAHIDQGEWRWGQVKAQFGGLLSLDEGRRLSGSLTVKATGAGPLLAQLGLPIAPGVANDLLGALFGQKPQDKPKDDSLNLSLRLAQGGLFLGPMQIGAMPPLY